jgi:hypothetical protein
MNSLFFGRAVVVGFFHTLAVLLFSMFFVRYVSDVVFSILPLSIVKLTFESNDLFYTMVGLTSRVLIEIVFSILTTLFFLLKIKERVLLNCFILALTVFVYRVIFGDFMHSWYMFTLGCALCSGMVILAIGLIRHKKYNN